MARRVNTKFVVILGSAMFVVAAGAAVYVARHKMMESDPVSLVKQGDEAIGAEIC